jgi:glyoxylase-like metal-dependent hydrolase (beta-lactamase superfamily II)
MPVDFRRRSHYPIDAPEAMMPILPRPARLFAIVVTIALGLAAAGAAVRAQAPVDEVIRTADINVRGLKRSDFPKVHRLADNVYVYSGLQQRADIEMEFTTNNLFVVTPEGVLVADAQITEADTRQLLAAIATVTPLPVRYVVIGSDHNDHVGGNTAFPAGTTFIAHPTSKAVIEARNRTAAVQLPIPTDTVSDKKTLMLGGTEIQVLFLGRAHTGGDLSVFLPRENILFMSEAYFNRLFPSLYGGYPSDWVATLKKAEAMNAAIYVPGHGFIDSPRVLHEELVSFRQSVEKVVSEGYRLRAAGVPPARAARSAILGPFGYWTRAAQNLPEALARVYAEAAGELK